MTREEFLSRYRYYHSAQLRLVREYFSYAIGDDEGSEKVSQNGAAAPDLSGTPVAQIVRTYDLDPVLPVPSSDPVQPELDRDLVRNGVPVNRDVEPPAKLFRTGGLEDLFADFWAAYPRRTGRKDALKAFMRLKPSAALVDRMLAAIEVQRRSRHWQDGYIPHPATWLNGERWTDDLETVPEVISGPMSRSARISARNRQTLAMLEAYEHAADAVGSGRDPGADDADDRDAGGTARRRDAGGSRGGVRRGPD